MSVLNLLLLEMTHRWKSSAVFVAMFAVISAAVSFVAINRKGFEKEVIRNTRDIGSNIVILPADVDQVSYHANGGFAEETMPYEVVEQLLEYKASLNHLIPMLEKKSDVRFDGKQAVARVVGISASIPMPGRPKSPMQKSVKQDTVQLGAAIAQQLGIERDQQATLEIRGKEFKVARVNRQTGTWQDAIIQMDLKNAQQLFQMPNKISRIEAIECTSEECERTGLKSDTILTAELSRITDQAALLRREQMAKARTEIRSLSRDNALLLQNALWLFLVFGSIGLAFWNTIQRKAEMGILQANGFGPFRIVFLLVGRALILSLLGAFGGAMLGAWISYSQSLPLFEATGKKFAVDWYLAAYIALAAMVLGGLAASLPAFLAASRHPADVIGRES